VFTFTLSSLSSLPPLSSLSPRSPLLHRSLVPFPANFYRLSQFGFISGFLSHSLPYLPALSHNQLAVMSYIQDEPLYYSIAYAEDDIICPESDADATVEEIHQKHERYETHACRYLQGHLRVFQSVTMPLGTDFPLYCTVHFTRPTQA
jgi:hypothetical protein